MVGVPGFEPGASWTRTKRDTKLRHTPMQLIYYTRGVADCQGRIFQFMPAFSQNPVDKNDMLW